MIKGLFYILLFYFLGEVIASFINDFIPGSVIGMMLLFLCLFFKILDPENVKSAATVITKNMAVFFVPVAVGLMVYAKMLSQSFVAILTAIGVSTILTIVVVAIVQEKMEKRTSKKEK